MQQHNLYRKNKMYVSFQIHSVYKKNSIKKILVAAFFLFSRGSEITHMIFKYI